eukprot:2828650-Prymnesium_polylepis.1
MLDWTCDAGVGKRVPGGERRGGAAHAGEGGWACAIDRANVGRGRAEAGEALGGRRSGCGAPCCQMFRSRSRQGRCRRRWRCRSRWRRPPSSGRATGVRAARGTKRGGRG